MDVNFTEFMKSYEIMNAIFGGSILNQNLESLQNIDFML